MERENPQVKFLRRAALLLLLALVIVHPCTAAAQKPGTRTTLTVVLDDNYPPYVFRNSEEQLIGILPDQWKLWEQKTGVKVDLQAMGWSEAQQFMREGHADVIDTIFQTEERDQLYDFTHPYAKIEVPVFAHETLGGITDVPSLQGFTIGVKKGDSVIGHLKNRGIHSLKKYPSYEAIIQAAKKHEIKVFSIDQPAAVYYLYKYGVASQFRQSFIIYTGEFHRAVPKNQPELLDLVQGGFDGISRREYRAIDQKWMGSPFLLRTALREWAPWLMVVATSILLLIILNIVLRRQVHARTAELRQAMGNLQKSLDEGKKSEEELRISQEYFADVVNSINEAILVQDAEALVILDVNQRMCEMYGYSSREEAVSSGMSALCPESPPYSLAESEEWTRKALTEGPQLFEWHARHQDGHLFWVEVHLRKVKLGPHERLVVTARDITDRKVAEEERLKFERRIQEAQKLESLGLLAGGIAHDFNNLLAAILGNIDLALLEIPEDSTAHEDIQSAVEATKRAADLVQQMLAYAGKGQFRIEAVELPQLIQETTQMLQASISKSAGLTFQLPADLPLIQADVTQLRQIIMNLVINASEALEGRPGSIALSAGTVEIQDVAPPNTWPNEPLHPGRYVYLEASDSGVGIRPELLEKIFDPFFSTKFTGRGLGLAAVLGIVRSHKGAVQVNSVLGKGTTFRILFPASSRTASLPVEPLKIPTATLDDGKGRLILLVDDEASLRETCSKLLDRLGYRVICATDGEQAIHLFNVKASELAGVILDLTMPGMDGVETLSKLRQIRSDIPVLVSSGHSEQDIRKQFEGLALIGFMPKPYSLNELQKALHQCLKV